MTATLCTCNHLADNHTALSGCLEEVDGTWCPCADYKPAPTSRQEGLAEGRALRDAGTEAAGSGTPAALASAWRAKAAEAMTTLARSGEEFSADDLVAIAGEPPVPNMLGGVFMSAARRDLINAVGFTTASRPSAHARVQRTWKGARS